MISTQKQPYNVHTPAFLNSFCPREAFMLSEAVRREVNLNNISEIIMIKQIFICSEEEKVVQNSPLDLICFRSE